MSRLRTEGGFTLVEAMMTCVLLIIVSGSATLVLVGATQRNARQQRQAEAVQQARIGMEKTVGLMRAQVCLTNTITPVAAASDRAVTFYADTTDARVGNVPVKHVLTADPATARIVDQSYDGTASSVTDAPPTYPSTPSRTRVLATGIFPSGTTPIFSYFAFTDATPADSTIALNSASSPTVAAADLPRIARIAITFEARSPGPNPALTRSKTVSDQVFVRAADPNFDAPDSTAPGPTCTF